MTSTLVAIDQPSTDEFHTHTVSRRLVHRAAVSEVFITGWHAESEHEFVLGAQWPRAHGYYQLPDAREHDPMLMAETIRQAGLLISHVGYGVPIGHQFLMESLSYSVDMAGLALDGKPATLMLKVDCQQVRMRRDELTSMRIHVTVERDGIRIGGGTGQLKIINPRVYSRVRGLTGEVVPSTPSDIVVRPDQVGRDRRNDVVLSPTGTPDTWWLRADTTHPVLFDHAVDHVPGMVVFEAARQAAQSLRFPTRVTPVDMLATFSRYIELDKPCLVRATLENGKTNRQTVRVVLEQNGETAVECLMIIEPLS